MVLGNRASQSVFSVFQQLLVAGLLGAIVVGSFPSEAEARRRGFSRYNRTNQRRAITTPPGNGQRGPFVSGVGSTLIPAFLDANGNPGKTLSVLTEQEEEALLFTSSLLLGTGSFENVMDEALKVWETALPDAVFPDISYGWADFGLTEKDMKTLSTSRDDPEGVTGDTIAGLIDIGVNSFLPFNMLAVEVCTSGCNSADTSQRGSTIIFNSQVLRQDTPLRIENKESFSTVRFYLEEDPLNKNSVFGPTSELSEEKISKLAISRSQNTTDDAIAKSPLLYNQKPPIEQEFFGDLVVDLFSVALHELGHSLGYSITNPDFDKSQAGVVVDSDAILNKASKDLGVSLQDISTSNNIPGNGSAHIYGLEVTTDSQFERTYSEGSLLSERLRTYQRRCPSDVDILVVAQLQNTSNFDLNPCATLASQKKDPKPSVPTPTLLLQMLAMGAKVFHSKHSKSR